MAARAYLRDGFQEVCDRFEGDRIYFGGREIHREAQGERLNYYTINLNEEPPQELLPFITHYTAVIRFTAPFRHQGIYYLEGGSARAELTIEDKLYVLTMESNELENLRTMHRLIRQGKLTPIECWDEELPGRVTEQQQLLTAATTTNRLLAALLGAMAPDRHAGLDEQQILSLYQTGKAQ